VTVGPALSFAERLHTASMRAAAPPDPARGAGVEDALREIPGIMAAMLVAFGANGIRTVEDLAACATDDLIGWTERLGAQATRHPGILDDLLLSRQECDAIIPRARSRAGWIEAAALTS
jgi:transcription termination/antitermination protein NusA